MTWLFQVDDSTESRYYIILARYILTYLLLDFKFCKHVISGGDILYEGLISPMVDMG